MSRPVDRVVKTCRCGNTFESLPVRNRQYCSRSCSAAANYHNLGAFAPPPSYATCEQCSRTFKVKKGSTRGRFCGSKCFGKWLSAHVVGDAHPRKGAKLGRRPHGLPPLLSKRCAICPNVFPVKRSQFHKRACCCRGCAGLLGGARRCGAANPNWRGGYEPYYGPSWRKARAEARRRDVVCQRCGKTARQNGRALEVHHVRRFKAFGLARHEQANALSNLICYCVSCHRIVEPRRAKRP